MTSRNIVAITLGALVVAGSGVLAWRVGADAAATPAVVQDTTGRDDLLRERSKGRPDAPITILEASDFQCPWCRRFWEVTLPVLEREYIDEGKARFVFLNFPIPSLHPNAAAAHELAMCAALQDRFWPTHDLLYAHQDRWASLEDPSAYFMQLADSARLGRDSLEACFASGEVRSLIQAEAQMAHQAGIQSTPSFVIEGALLGGAQPIEVWRPILDSIYAEKTGGR